MWTYLKTWWSQAQQAFVKPPRLGFFASPFDPVPLSGHVLGFREAIRAGACDAVIAAIHVDPTLDGQSQVYADIQDRRIVLESLREVHAVYYYKTEAELEILLKTLQPCVRLLDDLMDHKRYTGDDLNIPEFFCAAFDPEQRTRLIRRIQNNQPWHEDAT